VPGFVTWLLRRAWLGDARANRLFDAAEERLVAQRILLPGVTTLERLHERPARLSSAGIGHALDIIDRIQAVACHDLDLSAVPARRVLRLAQRTAILPRPTLAALHPAHRRAALVAFLHVRALDARFSRFWVGGAH